MSKKEETTPTRNKAMKKSKFAGKGKAITVPIVKLNVGDVVAFQFTGETRKQKLGADSFRTNTETGEQEVIPKEPATMLRATDLDTNELVDVIAPMVLLSTLEREYPEGYAGRKFVLEIGKRPNKKYNDVKVSELD